MLDWGALVPDEKPTETGENGAFLGHCPKPAPAFGAQFETQEPSNGAAFRDNAPSAPVCPKQKSGTSKKITETGAAAGAAPSDFCAQFPVNPSAVCLLLAYWKNAGGDMNELAGALVGLQSFAADEQARCWAQSCSDAGLDPWRVVHLQSAGEGVECTGCKHLCCRTDSLPHTRRRYFWLCDLHHQILEHYQRGERVLIAPQECKSWERWQSMR